MPSSGVLIALAGALGVTEAYLLGEPEITIQRIQFRGTAVAGKKQEAQMAARVGCRLERYLLVEERLKLAKPWERPIGSPYPIVAEVDEAEGAARRVREVWGLGGDPLPNLVELVEGRGIKVLSLALSDIDGLTAMVLRDGKPPLPVIILKNDAWSERKRFTLAHELGHLVLEVAATVDQDRASRRSRRRLLMPAETLWAHVGKRRTSISLGELAQLKRMFGVSLPVIVNRCKDLGILGPRGIANLSRAFVQRGWHRPPYAEIGTVDPALEEPRRLERLCLRALAEGALSQPRAADILGVSQQHLVRLIDPSQVS